MEEMRKSAAAGNLQYGPLKEIVGESLVAMTSVFREKRQQITADKKHYKERVKASSEIIRKRAQETVVEVKDLVGLMNVKF